MESSADVVIVGGGIAGCATAYYLAKKGVSNVILLEKDHLMSGATGQSAGGLRTQLTSDIKIRLAQESRKIFEQLQDELRCERDLELDEKGYLSLIYSEEGIEEMRRVIAFQKERGVRVDVISPEEAKEVFPALNTEGMLGAAFHKEGATINPHLTIIAFAEAAQRLGIKVYTKTRVLAVKTRGGKVRSVVTNKGEIETYTLVNAAGLALGMVSKMAGIDNVPLSVQCMDGWVTGAVDPIRSPSLTISWADPIFVFTQRKNGNIVLMGNVRFFDGIPSSYRDGESSRMLFETIDTVLRVFPNIKNMNVIRHWMGVIPVSPDDHPILGKVENVEGFYLAGPLCGHGFLMGPMIGKVMAETIVGDEPTISIGQLSLSRFEKGEELESHGLL